MDIYRTFTRQTDSVVKYLSVARLHEHHTRVEVPKLKHAPVNLGRQLEDYLKDPDFEIHRRQYLAEQDAKRKGFKAKPKATDDFAKPAAAAAAANNPFPETKPQANKGPDPDLIDFFDSIEQNQTPLQMQPQAQGPLQAGVPFGNGFASVQVPQQTGFVNDPWQQPLVQPQLQQPQPQPQQFQQLQPSFTGAGFGGFTPQPQPFQPGALGSIPQNTVADFQTGFVVQQPTGQPAAQPAALQPMQTGTNPFRQSMLAQQGFASPGASGHPALNRQSTNPFARASPQNNLSPFQPQTLQQSPQPLQPAPTGTNPFARGPPPQQQGLAPQPTGTTNPFRQGAFVNHATGLGWQHSQAPLGGGLDQLQTVPVFPRPAQQTPWQQ